jgi:membrane-associated phospholipid phosphatase
VHTSRRGTADDDGWTSEVSSGLALAGFLSLVFVAFTLLAMGPLAKFDAYFNLSPVPEGWVPFLHALDRIGQRAVCLPILAVATYLVCRRQGSWRPALLAGASVFMLNLMVLLLKLGLGREGPVTADPSFFSGGMAYPSGHSSNIVLVYGLVAYLFSRYHSPGRRGRVLLWGIVVVLSMTMVVTSVSLDWHWFADLVAGLLVGGIVLQVTVAVDDAVPAVGFVHGWRAGLRDLLVAVRPGKSQRPEGSA